MMSFISSNVPNVSMTNDIQEKLNQFNKKLDHYENIIESVNTNGYTIDNIDSVHQDCLDSMKLLNNAIDNFFQLDYDIPLDNKLFVSINESKDRFHDLIIKQKQVTPKIQQLRKRQLLKKDTKENKTNEDDLLQESQEITRMLQDSHKHIVSQIDQMNEITKQLDEDNSTVSKTNEIYSSVDEKVTFGSSIIRYMKRQNKRDQYLIYTSIIIFLLVIFYILIRRFPFGHFIRRLLHLFPRDLFWNSNNGKNIINKHL